MSVHRFPSLVAARRFARAIGRTYAAPLPRCDSPRWGGADVTQGPGRHPAECGCTSRSDAVEGCPYATTAHTSVSELDGAFFVRADATTRRANGRVVDVDGVSYEVRSNPEEDDPPGEPSHVWP